MKHKLSSILMAAALMVSLSVPTFAASCQIPAASNCPANTLLWQMLCRYSGLCGDNDCGDCGDSNCDDGSCAAPTLDVNALLGQLLRQYQITLPETPTQQEPSPEPQQPAQPEQPTKPEQPAEQESPAKPEQPAEPEQEAPAEPEQPVEPETPAQQPAESTASAYEREVIRLVNVERAKYGLAALAEDASLTRTARMKSQDMRDNRYFDHNSPAYGSPFDLMKAQGIRYRTAGENIAMGYATPEAVVSAWMNSSGHRANILNASYTRIGVGYVASGSYWTQHFTG